MNEVLTVEKLTDAHGAIAATGYARHLNFLLDKKAVNSSRLNEWDVYRIHFDGRYVLQLTLGHASCAMQASATLTDLASGAKHEINRVVPVRPSFSRAMPVNPEVAHMLQYFAHNLHVQFETTDKFRRLAFTANDYNGIKAEINLMLTNVSRSKEKLVVATQLDKPKHWCLNYVENCFVVNGYVRIEDVAYQIGNGFGILNWCRGALPYRCKWVWGNGGTTVNEKSFGFNIGWISDEDGQISENAFFYDNKMYKLNDVEEIRVGDDYRYKDADGKFDFSVEPIFDSYAKPPLLLANNKSHKVFGKWSGFVALDDGTRVKIPPFVAFCEHADN